MNRNYREITVFLTITPAGLLALLAGCSGLPTAPAPATPIPMALPELAPPVKPKPAKPYTAAKPSAAGKYFQNDGPLVGITEESIAAIPDATPRAEVLNTFTMRPYRAFGKKYVPMKEVAPYRAEGIGSWYGTKYHKKKTSTGERYDMLKMTAAPPYPPTSVLCEGDQPGEWQVGGCQSQRPRPLPWRAPHQPVVCGG